MCIFNRLNFAVWAVVSTVVGIWYFHVAVDCFVARTLVGYISGVLLSIGGGLAIFLAIASYYWALYAERLPHLKRQGKDAKIRERSARVIDKDEDFDPTTGPLK